MRFLDRLRRRLAPPVDRAEPVPAALRWTDEPLEFDGYVFVCGLHRSGTTLLEHLLAAYCDAAVLRAPVPENEGQHLQDVYDPAWCHGGAGAFAFAPAMHPAPPSPEEAAELRRRLLCRWTPWVAEPGRFLLEKSPPNLTKIPWLRAVFPGARFVVLTRDPRAVAMATRKWSHMTVSDMVYHWHVAHDAASAALGPDCHHLRYEDLCAAPEGAIGRLIDALDLPRRAEPREVEERFRDVSASNDAYLAELPPMRFGRGAWERFGHDLDG